MATVASKRSFAVMHDDTLLPAGPHRRSPYALSRDTSNGGRTQNRTPDGRDSRLATSAPPTPIQPQDTLVRVFDGTASIVLLGARGTGKSTLGVFASTALQRRLVETDTFFQELTGQSAAAFRKQYGTAQYHHRYLDVLKVVFEKHSRGCIIVCSAGSLDHDSQILMQEFAREHPVIHILRSAESVHQYLGIPETEKVTKLLRISDAIFRCCSNYEYFNYAEQSAHRDGTAAQNHKARAPSLALKNAERNFLRFLARATSAKDIPSLEDAFPLSQVHTEDRTFTYSVSISIQTAADPSLDIEAVEEGADAVELVVDPALFDRESGRRPSEGQTNTHRISKAVARIRRSVIVPIIYHAKPPREQGAIGPNPTGLTQYLESLHHGLRLGPDFVTIDLHLDDDSIRELASARGSTKLIADFYSERGELCRWDHEVWTTAYERARRLGFDVVRLSWPAKTVEDNFHVHAFRARIAARENGGIRLIAYNTSPLGRPSACFNPTLTPVTHPSVSSMDNRMSSPCLTTAQATKALYDCFVNEPMTFYIMGATTSYSLSPAMHNAAYHAYGMPHTYKTHQTSSVKDLHRLVSDPHFGGCSVSLPFKLEILALSHSLSKHAKAIGAVNTVVPVRHLLDDGSVPAELELFAERNRSGPVKAIYGENTDWQGIRACIRRGLSPANAVGPRTTALLIGAGGMARAAVYAMLKLGIQNIVIFNRTYENAQKLVAHFEKLVKQSINGSGLFPNAKLNMELLRTRDDPWPENLRQPTVVVSCIPTHRIGDNPSPDFTLPPQWLKSPTGGVVLEVAYRNLHTPLLEQTRAEAHRGWVAMDGLDLLPEQAFAQFELFTGRRAPRRLMRLEVLRNYRDEYGKPDPSVIQWRIDEITQEMP